MKKTITRKILALSVFALLYGFSGTHFVPVEDIGPQFVKTDGDYH